MYKLALFETGTIPIDFSSIQVENVANLSMKEFAKLSVLVGHRTENVGDIFAITQCNRTALGTLHFCGDTANVHGIGRSMSGGTIYVENNAGRHIGAGMTGGSITIDSSVNDWLGAEMKGGEILVRGNAGSQVGAAYRGSRRGMSGGSIHIYGHTGDETGLLMRRGLIRIDGNCGTFAGASMIAGTIVVKGALGPNAGAGMKRGTIITRESFSPSIGFRYACEYEPQYLNLLFQQHIIIDDVKTIRCYRGDLMTGGRGEIWQVVR